MFLSYAMIDLWRPKDVKVKIVRRVFNHTNNTELHQTFKSQHLRRKTERS